MRKVRKSNKLVYGVGINDANYHLSHYEFIEGEYIKTWQCPIYEVWRGMLRRCYSKKCHLKQPTYQGCSVCEEWLTFSNFKAWMETQDWEGKVLDKDILLEGNRVYSPDTCVFITSSLNSFITDRRNDRGDYMLGVCWKKDDNRFLSRCCNPFTGKREYLGLFVDELEAHLVWKRRKHELACMLADSEYCNDPRLAQALRTRYL